MGYQLDEVVGKKRLHFFTDESREYSKNEVLPKFLKDGYANGIKYDFVKKDDFRGVCLSKEVYADKKGFKKAMGAMERRYLIKFEGDGNTVDSSKCPATPKKINDFCK